jgi:hypothetical protein
LSRYVWEDIHANRRNQDYKTQKMIYHAFRRTRAVIQSLIDHLTDRMRWHECLLDSTICEYAHQGLGKITQIIQSHVYDIARSIFVTPDISVTQPIGIQMQSCIASVIDQCRRTLSTLMNMTPLENINKHISILNSKISMIQSISDCNNDCTLRTDINRLLFYLNCDMNDKR